MVRSTTTSISKTCPDCGELNTLVIVTTGIGRHWRIACSQCRAPIAGPAGEAGGEAAAQGASGQGASAQIVHLPVRRPDQPPAAVARRGALVRRGSGLPALPPALRAPAGATGRVAFVGVCLSMLAAFPYASPPDDVWRSGGDGLVSALATPSAGDVPGTPSEPASSVSVSPMPGGSPWIGPARAVAAVAAAGGTQDSARAAAAGALGDVGVASLIDLKRPLPEIYPDPREGMMAQQLAAYEAAQPVMTAEAAQAGEAALALSTAKRREVQRRLRLAEHDPSAIDGIFGPATRAAIESWQRGRDLPATGFLDETAMAALAEETDRSYRAWAAADRARRERERTQLASAEPSPRPIRVAADDGCPRRMNGKVAYGAGMRCDFRGLRDNIAGLFGKAERSPWDRVRRKDRFAGNDDRS